MAQPKQQEQNNVDPDDAAVRSDEKLQTLIEEVLTRTREFLQHYPGSTHTPAQRDQLHQLMVEHDALVDQKWSRLLSHAKTHLDIATAKLTIAQATPDNAAQMIELLDILTASKAEYQRMQALYADFQKTKHVAK